MSFSSRTTKISKPVENARKPTDHRRHFNDKVHNARDSPSRWVSGADFHDLSPRGFHHHSPTPGFCFLSFYQFSPFVAIIQSSQIHSLKRGAPAPHRRTEAGARRQSRTRSEVRAERRAAGLAP